MHRCTNAQCANAQIMHKGVRSRHSIRHKPPSSRKDGCMMNITYPGRRCWSRILIPSYRIVVVPRCWSPCHTSPIRPSATSIHPPTACDSSPLLPFLCRPLSLCLSLSPMCYKACTRRNGTNYTASLHFILTRTSVRIIRVLV